MKLSALALLLATALFLHWTVAVGAASAIGSVVTRGAFRIDRALVSGNGTLFEGSVLETLNAATSVTLTTGSRILIGAGSRARLFGNRLILERGSAQLDHSVGLRMEALGLAVQPEASSATGRLMIQGKKLQVAALTGSFRVLSANGHLVANLTPGAPLAFEPQAAMANVVRVAGCLENRSGHYLLTDLTTQVTVEVLGRELEADVGNRLEIDGVLDRDAKPAGGATQAVRASQVRRIGRGCGATAAPAAAGGAAGAAGRGGSAAGVSATTITIIGGVAAGAAIGGLAAADALPGQGNDATPPSASR